MQDPLFVILSAIFVIVGAIGVVAPILPGVPLCWCGLLMLKFAPAVQDNISWTSITLMGILTLAVTVLDNILPLWGTKKRGGDKKIVWGATLGLVFGFFLGPLGIIFGPFVGALAAGLLFGNKINKSLKSASGAFIGYIVGLVLKVITVGIILFFYIGALI